jgi:hypothetical protein
VRSYQLLDERAAVAADAYSRPIAATQSPRYADSSHAAIDLRPLGSSFNFMPGIPGKPAGMLPSTLSGQPNRPEM